MTQWKFCGVSVSAGCWFETPLVQEPRTSGTVFNDVLNWTSFNEAWIYKHNLCIPLFLTLCILTGFRSGLNSFLYIVSPLHHSSGTRAPYEIWFCWIQSLTGHVCAGWTGGVTAEVGSMHQRSQWGVKKRQSSAGFCCYFLHFKNTYIWMRNTSKFYIWSPSFCIM